jgi:hypothetical protein
LFFIHPVIFPIDSDDVSATISSKLTIEELETLQEFELDDGDGKLDRAEYILLCALRVGK